MSDRIYNFAITEKPPRARVSVETVVSILYIFTQFILLILNSLVCSDSIQ